MQGLANTSKNGLRYKPEIAKSEGVLDCRDHNVVGSLIEKYPNKIGVPCNAKHIS